MEQVVNLVFDIGVDSQEFHDEMPRIAEILKDAAGETARAEARQARFLESLKKTSQAAVEGAERVSSSATRQKQAVALTSQAYAEMAQRVDLTQRHIAELNQKWREEQSQAAAVAAAQDQAAAAFYRQIDGVKKLGDGLNELQRIQARVRQAKGSGGISQQDYLALVSDITRKTRELTDAETKSTEAKKRFIQQLKEQITAQKLTRTELLRVRAAELGVSSAADTYIRKLEKASTATHSLGLKSASARRELSVIIGELARGDFGALRGSSITLANRAGWIDKLLTLRGLGIAGVVGGIAGAVIGLGKAWYEGSKESEEFNKQLILTGNYAGKTTDELNRLAKQISGNGVTQNDAAGVLAQVVGSGAFSGQAVDMVARTAARMKQATGQAVDETISQFKRLKDDPVNAVVALNNALHFLTAAQYQEISAAQAQGDSHRAAALAMQAYSDAVNQRVNAVKDNLGTLEKAWNWVKNEAAGAWDAMLGVGRNPGAALNRQNAFAEWQAAEKEFRKLSGNLNVDPNYDGDNWVAKAEAERLRNARQQLELKKAAYEQADKVYAQEGLAAGREKQRLAQQEQSIRNQQRFNQLVHSGAQAKDKQAAAEKELNALIAKNRQDAKDGIATLWTDKDIAAARAGIEKAFKEARTVSPRDDEATRLLTQLRARQAQLQGEIDNARIISNQKLTESEKQLLALTSRIAGMKGKTLTAADKSVLAHRQELELQLQLNAEKEKELNRQTALNELKKKGVQLTAQLAEEEVRVRQQHALTLATQGMGDKQRGRYEEELKLRQHYQEQLDQLERSARDKGSYGSEEYRLMEGELQESLERRLAGLEQFNASLDAAQGNWSNGASRALENFVAQGSDVAGLTESVFTSAFNSMSDSLANFALTGKMNFRSLTVSILSDLAKMAARIAASKALGMLINSFGGSFGGASAGSGANALQNFGASFNFNADGGVYRSADLSRYSGSIVNGPTFFAFAKGAGVMGEAGPEAILPLKRTSNGKLGVVAEGMGGLAMFAPQYNIEINNDGNNGQIGPEALNAVYGIAKKAAADFLQQQGRDGGRLSGAYT